MGLLANAALVAGVAVAAMQAPAVASPHPTTQAIHVPCSTPALASAITTANLSPAILKLAPNCSYNLTTALPLITGRITLKGTANTAIKRDPGAVALRILEVSPAGNLTVEDLFILNGQLGSTDGAGIRNEGNLYLRRVTVSGNQTSTGSGGGLYNLGRATIRNSLFTTNLTLTGNGAGIYNNGDLHIIDSAVAGNVLNNHGGGIYTAAGRTSKVVRTAVNGNLSATQAGGGIASAGITTLDNSWVRLNKSILAGGGVVVLPGGVVTLHRSGVRDNSPTNCAPVNTVQGCVN
ncbi:hypothetical protein [Herbidospora mongoliensis]|uniref:hypothetical protein n=1 Tax=Herbidospora mongoliensis TaxID=688067 RepID=UPI00082BF534|nr:hypothetical protein [Herbidospora mongoliensis]